MPGDESGPQSESLYFDLQADFGMTKHLGGRKATDELLSLCQIQPNDLVLEIGCGIGGNTVYLAERYDCRVVAFDLRERMASRTRTRALRRGVAHRVYPAVADALYLPFADGVFDVVIAESVFAFLPDPLHALRECARVLRAGGHVGLNEVTWMQPPPPSLERYAAFVMGGARFRSMEEWSGLLVQAGLADVRTVIHPFNAWEQYAEELRQLDLEEYVRAWRSFFSGFLTNPDYRRFTRDVLADPRNLFRFTKYIGGGLYVGRK